jgi:transposase-like protein
LIDRRDAQDDGGEVAQAGHCTWGVAGAYLEASSPVFRSRNKAHLLRASFRYACRQRWATIAKALRPVYTAPTEAAASEPQRDRRAQVRLPGVMSLDPTGQGRKRRVMRWKGALIAFDIAFDARLSAGRN